MDVLINRHALSDAPYQEGNEGVCTFDQSQIDNFVGELVYGNQTCYLISGYRGVGKTSFINRVRQLVEEKSQRLFDKENKRILSIDKTKPETYCPVFVYTSFAKYNSQTAFLRQMIRSLFLAFEEKKVNGKPISSLLKEDINKEFWKLNRRTFFDVKTQQEISKETTTEQTFEINTRLDNLAIGIIKIAIPAPALILAEKLFKYYEWPTWVMVILWIVGIAYFIWSLFQLKITESEKASQRESESTNELYDDEIASYHFEKTLKNLKSEGFKIVFILDELDKVNDKEISNLINEMKPHLLSGWADFVVVAGQQLTYKYVSAFSEDDDEVVGSLFSKVFHVQLKRTSELHSIVKEKIFITDGLNELQLTQLDEFIVREVFHSSRIPRILINQIRQAVTWKDDQPYLTIPDSVPTKKYQEVIEALDGIIKDTIDTRGHKEVVRDYLIVQLFRTAIKLDGYNGREVLETDILGKFQKSSFSHHPLYFYELAPCLTKLLTRLQPVLNLNFPKESTGQIFENSVTKTTNAETIQSSQISKSAFSRTLEAFKQELHECSWVLKVTYMALGEEDPSKISKYTPHNFLTKFVKKGFLQLSIPDDPLFKNFLNSPHVLDNKDNLFNAYKIAQDARIDFNTVAYKVLEGYLQRTLKSVFNDYALTKLPGDTKPDYLLINDTEDLSDLLLDFKFLKSGISNLNASEIANKLIQYNVESGKGNYFALVVFTSEAKESYAADVFKLRSELRNFKLANSNIVIDDKFTVIIISIQFLATVHDELTSFKNKMFAYKIDNSGLPTEADFRIIPNKTFTFQNQLPPSTDFTRNDHTLLEIYKIPSQLRIDIVPVNSSYWRFGLKFSSDGLFPKFEEGRHIESYPDIHISVGEPKNENGNALMKEGKLVWGNPERLQITNYYIVPEESDWSFSEYKGGNVTLEIRFMEMNKAILKVFADGKYVNMFTYIDGRLKFFKLSAWADHVDFKLNTQILVDTHEETTVLGGKEIGIASPSCKLPRKLGHSKVSFSAYQQK